MLMNADKSDFFQRYLHISLFSSLKNPIFARLYTAQTISLLGDALTWVGLALLAVELAAQDAAVVLSGGLTLRVTAFVLISPLAGSFADRFDRKQMLALTHLVRMVVVAGFPFVSAIWQLYILIFLLNALNACFTPTYRATIPLVTGKDDYPQAIALAGATGQLLSILGPGIAGGVAALLGAKQVFFLDALSFLIAGVLIATLPGEIGNLQASSPAPTVGNKWQEIKAGTTRLLGAASLRYALGMQLVAAIAGAQILVNTVGYVEETLKLGSVEYGWVMAAFGTGATVAAIVVGLLNQNGSRLTLICCGAVLIALALLPANYAMLFPLMMLWMLAGVGESWINIPTQTLIADCIPSHFQGRVYGAHFAWSHLWWVFAYPLAGWHSNSFMYGGLIGLAVLVVVQLTLFPKQGEQETVYQNSSE
jgi:NRE family putative nickel resistance protein-like MFS transporter